MKTSPHTFALLFAIAFFSFPAFSSAQTIEAGSYSSKAICFDSTTQSWGLAEKLGNGNLVDSNVPVSVSTLTGLIAITDGNDHSLALKNDGTVWAWGGNGNGQLGDGTFNASLVPLQISALSGIIAIAAGGQHSLFLKNDGTVWTCGLNTSGELGDGVTPVHSNIPVQAVGLTGIIAVSATGINSLALKSDGTVWAWGDNASGQIGNGTTGPDAYTPVQVSSLTGITTIAGGAFHSLALKNDGTLWAWGENGSGQLGNGSNTSSNIPIQISSITGIAAIAIGSQHSLCLKNDGTVWTWGKNFYGELGNGTNANSNVPVQVSSLTGITAIAGGFRHSLFLKNDGTLWACGYNLYGELGNGTNTDSNVPVQVNGLCQITTTINEVAEQSVISIFPNPNNGIFQVELPEGVENATIEIINIMGEIIYTETVSEKNSPVNMNDAAPGLYLIRIITENNIVTSKFIKQ